MIAIALFQNGLPPTTIARSLASSSSSMSGVGERDCIFEEVLEVDIAGGREVELIGVCELHVLGLIPCVGCDIVQADHAPDGGVAQGVIHGVLVRHHGRNQEEVEEELRQEEERQEEEDNTQTTTCTCMDGMR